MGRHHARGPHVRGAVVGTLTAVVLAAAVPGSVRAQVPARPAAPTRPPRATARDTLARDSTRRAPAGATGIGGQNADTTRARRDTAGVARAGADSARADTALITWAAEDSTFTALRARAGYDAVRYQGDTVRFRADQRVLTLRGKPAAVERGPTVLVGNTVRYDDSLQVVTAGVDSLAAGDSVVLRDPSQGSDVIVRGGIRYDLSERRGTVSGFNTAVAQGETWFVRGGRGAFATDSALADSAGGGRIFYAHEGAVTSCDDTEPHYHFVARDIKLVSKRLLVIRPATLYIGNVPVLWLPFVFQDTRPGRRSGLLRPLFGVAELLRNSPSYQRSIRNLGYYTTIGDYADVKTWLDYRSGARPGPFGVGLLSFNAESRYKNIDRFIDGNLAVAYDRQSDGARNARVSWQHAQAFNQDRRFTANVNLTQNTQVQRRNQFNLGQVLGTISSSVNLQDKFGPVSASLGAQAQQFPGRPQRNLSFPQLNLTSRTISVAPWLDWTPTFSVDNQQSFRLDQATQLSAIYRPRLGGGVDSTVLRQSSRNSTVRFDTPLKIAGFQWQNSFSYVENVRNSPQTLQVIGADPGDTSQITSRLFSQTFASNFDWNTSFSLPSLFQGTWNLTPQVNFENVGTQGLLFRTERSGGRWVAGRKRPRFGVATAPTVYAFLPGFGRVERFRHSLNPTFSYGYAPRADVSDDYLRATGNRRGSFLGAIQSNQFSLGLSTNIEAKIRPRAGARRASPADSQAALPPETNRAGGITTVVPAPAAAPDTAQRANAAGVVPLAGGSANDEARKVRVLSANMSGVSYDLALSDSLSQRYFSRRGITTSTFNYTLQSDLLPGFSFQQDYSLFLGNPQSDTAQFKPYRTGTSVRFTLDRNSAVLGALARVFGRDLSASPPTPSQNTPGLTPGGDPGFARQAVSQRVAGSDPLDAAFGGPTGQGFTLSVSYTSQRQRPDLRGTFVNNDPAQLCRGLATPFEQSICLGNVRNNPTPGDTINANNLTGGVIFVTPPQQSLQANSSFNITQKWSAQWSTTYDAVRREFAYNQVSLARELHDWRANFSFTQSANGNSLFSFFIALKAQPDVRLPFNRQTIRATQ